MITKIETAMIDRLRQGLGGMVRTVKGYRGELDDMAVQMTTLPAVWVSYGGSRIDTKNTHGTGCTFSSAIASNLALGYDVAEAAERAKRYVTTAIEHALPIGKGHGPTHHFYDLYREGLRGMDGGERRS